MEPFLKTVGNLAMFTYRHNPSNNSNRKETCLPGFSLKKMCRGKQKLDQETRLYRTNLDDFWTYLDLLGPIWINLKLFSPFWNVWTNLDQFGPILTLLDTFGHIFDKFGVT